eukprot:215479-Hanusia_phi.AAC.1
MISKSESLSVIGRRSSHCGPDRGLPGRAAGFQVTVRITDRITESSGMWYGTRDRVKKAAASVRDRPRAHNTEARGLELGRSRLSGHTATESLAPRESARGLRKASEVRNDDRTPGLGDSEACHEQNSEPGLANRPRRAARLSGYRRD